GRWLVDLTFDPGPPADPSDAADLPDDIELPDIGMPGDDVEAGPATPPPLDDPQIDDDPTLETYAQGCYDGDMVACDDLYWSTDIGSELEEYAMSCGGRLDPYYGGDCEDTLG